MKVISAFLLSGGGVGYECTGLEKCPENVVERKLLELDIGLYGESRVVERRDSVGNGVGCKLLRIHIWCFWSGWGDGFAAKRRVSWSDFEVTALTFWNNFVLQPFLAESSEVLLILVISTDPERAFVNPLSLHFSGTKNQSTHRSSRQFSVKILFSAN